jgi:hypothetical protein
MDHFEAIKGKLAEGYLLGELSREQREAYEEHYFGCPECAKDVRLGSIFLANMRVCLLEEPDLTNG